MGKFKKFFSETVNESSLSRLHAHMKEHDAGTITAYRSEYTKKENQQRNQSLLAKLSAKRYQITGVMGSYIENWGQGPEKEKEVREHVYFVVDANDTGTLEADLRQLGEEFEQDSIMFIPKGQSTGILWGTSKKPGLFIAYGKNLSLSNAVWGERGEFMTKVKNRPFFFESVETEEIVLPEGYFGRMGCSAAAKAHWSKLSV